MSGVCAELKRYLQPVPLIFHTMLQRISDNIISKFGFTSEENYSAVKNGFSAIEHHANMFDVPEPFAAALINRSLVDDRFALIAGGRVGDYTHFEKLCILSIHGALQRAAINPAAPDVLLVLSTTKGNVHLLHNPNPSFGSDRVHLWKSAQLIAEFFGITSEPVVVSNACISGLSAQVYANWALSGGGYKTAIVTGGEMLSKFVISGFQSFKALSVERCRPFDASRCGLNLGEAAATIIYQSDDAACAHAGSGGVRLVAGAIRNDANHISGPSRTGEGLFNAIDRAMRGIDRGLVLFIGAHGTATPYNDEMEAIAIERAGMLTVPVNSLKAYFGHTLGAAGVLESIIGMYALTEGVVIKSLGYETHGVTSPINVCAHHQTSSNPMFVKLMSGFGGSNAAVVFQKGD